MIPFTILWSGADKYPQENNNLPIVDFVQFINKFFTPQVVDIHNFSSLGQNLLFSLFVKHFGHSRLEYIIIIFWKKTKLFSNKKRASTVY